MFWVKNEPFDIMFRTLIQIRKHYYYTAVLSFSLIKKFATISKIMNLNYKLLLVLNIQYKKRIG